MNAHAVPAGLDEGDFRFWMPLSKAGVEADGKRWIEGIASDEGEDLQGEQVVQKGLDLDYFTRHGFFNWDHQDVIAVQGPGGAQRLAIGKIGEPTVARLTDQGLFVRGFLYKGNPLADAAWELACSLDASGAQRRLGFSIQGKTLRRQGARILKAWIQDVAITPAPVNPRTYVEVRKSLGLSPDEFQRALATGYGKGTDAPADEGEGGALRIEALDGGCAQCGCRARSDRRLSRAELVPFIQLQKGYSRATAELIADLLVDAFHLGRRPHAATTRRETT